MLFQDIEHNIIMSIKEESKVIFKTLNISEKVFFISTRKYRKTRLSKNIEIFYNKYFPI